MQKMDKMKLKEPFNRFQARPKSLNKVRTQKRKWRRMIEDKL